MDLVIMAVLIGTSFWVYFDAKSIGIKAGEVKSGRMAGLDTMGPGSWLAGCLILWIIFFPIYLVKRGEFKRINHKQ